MIDMSTTTLMSFADFELLDHDTDDLELLRGEVIGLGGSSSGLPERRHMQICRRLFKRLDAAVEKCRGSSPEVRIGGLEILMGYLISSNPPSWLRPEVSLTYPDQVGDRYFEGGPLLAFEVVSEHDLAIQLNKKVADYLAHGTAEVWVIYPDSRYAWVYRQSVPGATRETEAIRSDLLPGIEIPLNDVL
jgi:Uma2 family endonuclease